MFKNLQLRECKAGKKSQTRGKITTSTVQLKYDNTLIYTFFIEAYKFK